MSLLLHEKIDALQVRLDQGVALQIALPEVLGGVHLANGFWRFYARSWPGKGIDWWNLESPWKASWHSFLPPGLFSFGEDVFGNQLVVIKGREEVFLLNHENADGYTLYLNPIELLKCILESGIEWIDFYKDGSLQLAREFGVVPEESHLHWNTPLILGGTISRNNLSLVPRDQHHVGHAKLWGQIIGLSPGTVVLPNRGR